MKILVNNVFNYEAAEEYYSLFMFLKKELNEDVLIWEDFFALYFFNCLFENGYIDRDYILNIRENLGKYYLGESSKKASLDCKLLIDYIFERESLVGRSKEDIENFFLYHIAKMLEKDTSNLKDKSMKTPLNLKMKDLGFSKDKDCEEVETELVRIPKNIRDMKLEYFNMDNISQKLEFLEESISDKNCLEVIKNLKKQLTK